MQEFFIIYILVFVVICLKFTTFVVATTVFSINIESRTSCDLLKIYYLCGSNNSYIDYYAEATKL